MKKQYFLFGLLIVASVTFAWQKTGRVDMRKVKTSHSFVSGSPAGRTGAPGELTCATSGCHGGTAMSGATENNFFVTYNGNITSTYIPGETYDIGVSMTSAATKKGFQVTVLDGSDNFVGTLTPSTIGGTTSVTGMGRTYINQSSTGSLSPIWAFEWTAPATDAGAVRFYLATNKTNNNGTNSGDEIYTSTHVLGSTASLSDNAGEKVADFIASFSAQNSSVYLSYSSLINGTSHVNIVDMNGRSVFNIELDNTTIGQNKEMVRLPESVKNGMYVVHFFVDNLATSKVISIQK